MPLLETKGAASAQGFGEFAQQTAPIYIEDVFSTWLYTGSSSALTITNGIDLATKGGMIWLKNRVAATYNNNYVMDTARGNSRIITNLTNAANTGSLSSFNTNGFTLLGGGQEGNENGVSTVSWTFREQPKFFDVVTYTGNGSNVSGAKSVSHSLGSVPGSIIIKRTDTSSTWIVYHRSVSGGSWGTMWLNTTDAFQNTFTGSTYINSTTIDISGLVGVGTASLADLNANGGTYVAYLFAHNAGGFGLTGADNVISCGSFTTDGSGNATIDLGYEPQWVMTKRTDSTSQWFIQDTMRGFTANATSSVRNLYPNLTNAEATASGIGITSTGFVAQGQVGSNATWIYIAIRRGPMKTPTTGTSVYNAITRTGTGSAATISTVGFPPDWVIPRARTGVFNWWVTDRLRGANQYLFFDQTNGEGSDSSAVSAYTMNGFSVGTSINVNESGRAFVNYAFLRAPGFFDEVCYTGDGTDNRQVIHNLGVTPEFVIVKPRSVAWQWWVYHTGLGNTRQGIVLNSTAAKSSNVDAFSTNGSPFSSSYFLQSASSAPYPPNASGYTYVAYLFATCPGVSKVGSYTGTGALQTINCGFTGGARFVLIKRTDSTGDWYVYDSARGISSGNDPYLLLNSTAAEVTGTNYVDTTSVGFQVTAAAPADLNANGGTYIFLAIA